MSSPTNLSPSNPLFQQAYQQYQEGHFEVAIELCQQALQTNAQDEQALNLLLIVTYQQGNFQAALEPLTKLIELRPEDANLKTCQGEIYLGLNRVDEARDAFYQAVANQPDNAMAWDHLGVLAEQQNSFVESCQAFQKAIAAKPDFVMAHYHLGILLQKHHQPEEAIFAFKQVLLLQPGFIEALLQLGHIFTEKGEIQEAISYYQQVVSLNPQHYLAWNSLGMVLQAIGRLEEAIAAYGHVIQLKPDLGVGFYNLGSAFKASKRLDEAIAMFERAISLIPSLYQAHYNLANAWGEQGNWEGALEAYKQAFALAPHDLKSQWGICFAQIPHFYAKEEEIEKARHQYQGALEQLIVSFSLDNPSKIKEAAEAVGSHQPFYLAYQNKDDRLLQERYGKAMSQIMSARYPNWTKPSVKLPLQSGEKIRVGFVSAFFNLHSNWKVPIQGWIQNWDRSQFTLYGYSTGSRKDAQTEKARQLFDYYCEDLSFEALCQKISADEPHVLIFPEIGMAPVTFAIACLRLAPIQCSSWGHPQTSGLPTIDYFLSSDLMEPSEADTYYSETLVRLPNLSICYTPQQARSEQFDLSVYGVRSEAVRYLCCQTLFKYLPQHDWIYPAIAQRVPNAQFLFVASPPEISPLFKPRFEQAFSQSGLDSKKHLVMLPPLDSQAFASLLSQGHVFLDSIGWSGCNSTLEALDHALPIITLPGQFMRGRHSTAVLTMMGVTETIVDSEEAYVDLAVQLGQDSAFRDGIYQKMIASRDRLYNDLSSIRALESFLQERVQSLSFSASSS